VAEDFDDFLRDRTERGEPTRRLLIGVLAGTCIVLAVLNVVLALWLSSERVRSAVEAPTRWSREVSARAAPVAEPPLPSASIQSSADSPPSVTLPTTTEPAPTDPRAGSAPPGRTPRADAPRAEPPRAPTSRADTPLADTPRAPAPRTDTPVADADAPRAEASRGEAAHPETPPADEPSVETVAPAEPEAPALELPPRTPAPSSRARRTYANAAPGPTRAKSTPRPEPAFATREEATAAWMLSTYGRAEAQARARAALKFYDARSAEGRYWRRVLGLIAAAH
jgi:hypothetical protein